ncbi:hypothetical protein E2C01_102262 [Portunus trituberculatus]|uniref:Uncharacterized protein n=1 Tax=Portunus trituberculatus TaxID=210409 RepID=A0A5B7KM62_PORTR|nr:hypothetical protein [Portunus trituberculatus]
MMASRQAGRQGTRAPGQQAGQVLVQASPSTLLEGEGEPRSTSNLVFYGAGGSTREGENKERRGENKERMAIIF